MPATSASRSGARCQSMRYGATRRPTLLSPASRIIWPSTQIGWMGSKFERERRNRMYRLAEKVALITGSSRGIGAAIAKRLAADGAKVAITYSKDDTAASDAVRAIKLGGGQAIAIKADAADAAAVGGAVEKAVAAFGQLDILGRIDISASRS